MSNPLTIDHLIDANPLVAPATETVGSVRRSLQPGRPLLVFDDEGLPLAVLTEELAALLPDPEQTLGAYADSLLPPAVTNPGASLPLVLVGMLRDERLRWHVVWGEEGIRGVVSPERLFAELDRLRRQPARTVDRLLRQALQFLNLPSRAPLLLSLEQLAGDVTVLPDRVCFFCKGAGSPHHVVRGKEVRRPPDTRPYCPDHPRLRLLPQNPCPDG